MMKETVAQTTLPASPTPAMIALDPAGNLPLYRQLIQQLRDAIVAGRLGAGVRLPATRALAASLGVSRNTVRNAYDQLLAEGYLDSNAGAGTFVSERLPAFRPARPAPVDSRDSPLPDRPARLSHLGQVMQSLATAYDALPPRSGEPADLMLGTPALDALPLHAWGRIAGRLGRTAEGLTLGPEQAAAGLPLLRQAIADYLGSARAVRCRPEQVFIMPGTGLALYLAGQLLLNAGDQVWLENPGYPGAMGAARFADAELVHVPVDEQGLDVAAGVAAAPAARLAAVTPSHQYPLGMTMSMARRAQLLAWAGQNGSWILEDDYDSEYRYDGRPHASLQGLDTAGRVLYLGTFSKVLFPALRLSYLVLPPELVRPFRFYAGALYLHPPVLSQLTLAHFMIEGHFVRHIGRMRRLYRARRDALLDAVARRLGGLLRPGPSECGLHITCHLPANVSDVRVAAEAGRLGLGVQPLSPLCQAPVVANGLLAGFANDPPERMPDAVARLARAIELAQV